MQMSLISVDMVTAVTCLSVDVSFLSVANVLICKSTDWSKSRGLDRLLHLLAASRHCGLSVQGNWTTRGYAISRIANSRTGDLVDWTTRGLADAAKKEN